MICSPGFPFFLSHVWCFTEGQNTLSAEKPISSLLPLYGIVVWYRGRVVIVVWYRGRVWYCGY